MQLLSEKEDDVIIGDLEHLDPFTDDEHIKAYRELINLVIEPNQSSYIELKKYRLYVPVLLANIIRHVNENLDLEEENTRIRTGKSKRSNKHWTNDEDELLIDLVCSDVSMFEIAITLGRTVPSISNRLTKLVGLNRISQQVAGKFIGTANGEEFKANLVGTIYKGKE